MRPILSILAAGAVVLQLCLVPAFAETPAKPAAQTTQASKEKEDASRALPADSVTQHTVSVGGERLSYTVTAGTLPLTNPKGEIAAKVFYTAYVLDKTDTTRPVTFAFNGGPGAASAFLHLGALGPRVINFTANGAAAVQPVQLADNPDTWLGFTDLVFVDPPGTGFSRTTSTGDDAERQFYGPEKDADAMADFVRLYLTRTGRTLRPVVLVGESYGGFRAVLVAKRLVENGIQVKGAILVSPVLEYSVSFGDKYLPLTNALRLPSIAAANIGLHKGIDAPLDSLGEVERFVFDRYLPHLNAGTRSNDNGISAELARLTGIDASVIERHRGRVATGLFLDEYKKHNDRVLSRYDAAVSAPVPKPGDHVSYDPILDGVVTVLAPAMVQYASDELGFRTDLPYLLLNRDVNREWDYGKKHGYAGSLDDLEEARTRNLGLRVLIVHGYTDLVTVYSASRYLIDQLAPIEGAEPVQLRVYRGGHMMYMRPPSRQQLQGDALAFYKSIAGR